MKTRMMRDCVHMNFVRFSLFSASLALLCLFACLFVFCYSNGQHSKIEPRAHQQLDNNIFYSLNLMSIWGENSKRLICSLVFILMCCSVCDCIINTVLPFSTAPILPACYWLLVDGAVKTHPQLDIKTQTHSFVLSQPY